MKVFDRVDPRAIDERETHLWMLACAVIVVLATGSALLMYPSLSSERVLLNRVSLRFAFVGFCTLSALLAIYLAERHLMVRRLRRQLSEEQRKNLMLRRQASADLLENMPRFGHFQDRLAMEVRRAATTAQPLSVVVLELKPSPRLSDPDEITTACGDAAKALTRKLRAEDTISLFRAGLFGIILPGLDTARAKLIAARLADGLQDASGACDRFTFEIRVLNVPEHARTAQEIEQAIGHYLPDNLEEVLQAEASQH